MVSRSRESMCFLLPLLWRLGLTKGSTNIFRYIGDLEQEIKSLEGQIAAAETIYLTPGTPNPVNTRISGDKIPEIPQRDSLPERRERQSPNFVEGGGIR